MATPAHAQLLDGALSGFTPPLLDSHLATLALVVGPTMLLDALDLIDKRSVARITTPAGAPVYQVAASSSSAAPGGSYTLYLDLPGGGYCPCAFFSSAVLAPGATAVIVRPTLPPSLLPLCSSPARADSSPSTARPPARSASTSSPAASQTASARGTTSASASSGSPASRPASAQRRRRRRHRVQELQRRRRRRARAEARRAASTLQRAQGALEGAA